MKTEGMVPVPGVFRVVEAEELPGLTMGGWRLVGVLPESQVAQGYEEIHSEERESRGYGGLQRLARSYVIQATRFLLQKEEGSALAELTERIQRLEQVARDDSRRQVELQKEAEALKKSEQELKALAERGQRSYEAVLESAQKERALRQKLEGDLAKIANAIGALQMKEILAPEAK